VIFAGTRGYADDVPLDRMAEWEQALLRHMDTVHSDLVKAIATEKKISPELEAKLEEAIQGFMTTWH